MNIKSSVEILEQIYKSMSNGIRSAKANSPRQWLSGKRLSFDKTYAAFNSGQMHHRKPQAFIDELLSIGFLEESKAATNTGKTGYSSFGNFSIIFPLKNKDNQIVNLYEMGIKKTSHSYLNDTGVYPAYPHLQTKKLILTDSILDAATILDASVLDNKEAVMALHQGELKPSHKEAIARLGQLEEVIYLSSKKQQATTNK